MTNIVFKDVVSNKAYNDTYAKYRNILLFGEKMQYVYVDAKKNSTCVN